MEYRKFKDEQPEAGRLVEVQRGINCFYAIAAIVNNCPSWARGDGSLNEVNPLDEWRYDKELASPASPEQQAAWNNHINPPASKKAPEQILIPPHWDYKGSVLDVGQVYVHFGVPCVTVIEFRGEWKMYKGKWRDCTEDKLIALWDGKGDFKDWLNTEFHKIKALDSTVQAANAGALKPASNGLPDLSTLEIRTGYPPIGHVINNGPSEEADAVYRPIIQKWSDMVQSQQVTITQQAKRIEELEKQLAFQKNAEQFNKDFVLSANEEVIKVLIADLKARDEVLVMKDAKITKLLIENETLKARLPEEA